MALIDDRIEAYAAQSCTQPLGHIAALISVTETALPHYAGLSGPVVGSFLETLAWIMQPRLIVEVGTFSGVSAAFLAAGMPSGSRLITLEADPVHATFARKHLARDSRIELVEGAAVDTIGSLPDSIDLAFIDADKENYCTYLEAILPKLSDHGLIVADNTLLHGRVLDPRYKDAATLGILSFNETVAKDPRLAAVLLTVRDGLTLVRKRL